MSISFSLKFPIKPFKIINSDSKILLSGSCFTEHIGNFLQSSGFSTTINPFGILYNPVSIANSLNFIIDNKVFCEEDLHLTHEKKYISFDHHGRFSGIEKNDILDNINNEINKSHLFLKNADCLIITLGSAWAYSHLALNKIVANCHKVPNKEFSKSLLPLDLITEKLNTVVEKIKNFNDKISIIFTVSPVKHLADGIVENQQSKATLILSIKNIVENNQDYCYYFPSYEIVTDELRDYRFYENDHAHPTPLATAYVWERFVNACFDNDAAEKVKDSAIIEKYLNHKQITSSDLPNPDIFKKIEAYIKKYNK
ncbi:MAG: GSCFA domain-containing protein [Bacteroidia bacterium]|nr:GSCFA domain-containing protein [Bacteroidia bacterium]